MLFTSFTYFYFLLIVVVAYWLLRRRMLQNVFLLVASYIFYGWIHPWFCILIAVSTITDYWCGLGMKHHGKKRIYLIISLLVNLGMLGWFKYFNFFSDNIHAILTAAGLEPNPWTLEIFLPVGISFYTFQTLSYSLDIYRGKMEPRTNFIDFALFVSFFPQLVAGPIERAERFLPQIENDRRWDWDRFFEAFPLIIKGLLKKMVIADNVAIYVNKIFMLEEPSLALLYVGSLAFAVQIYGDFSGYTDIARGSAKLIGFDLVENFKSPYIAISPSDFWRRWHISFSSWIRDYLYISLGGSRVSTQWQFAGVLVLTMGLSGLWHGAAWNFIIWGLYHGLLVYCYHAVGKGGRWAPQTKWSWLGAWALMLHFTLLGWLFFRASSMGWLFGALGGLQLGLTGDSLIVCLAVLSLTLMYWSLLGIYWLAERFLPNQRETHALLHGLALTAIIVFSRDTSVDFIYFQF
jgi:D-alanyl-lipoteichoic acid acyltransferase DltB (MBOAT superfamily)